MKTFLQFLLRPVLCLAPALAAAGDLAWEKHLAFAVLDPAGSANLVLAPGPVTKVAANPLLRQEHPWEPSFDNLCPSVLWDEEEGIYKLWYSIFVVNVPDLERTTPVRRAWLYRESGVCYATSRDGLSWEKPLFAHNPFRGQPSNIVLRDAHGAGVFKDARETDPARRYKMIFQRERNGRRQNLAVAFSADGVNWSAPLDLPDVTARGDTHNNAFWSPGLGRYVAITRDWEFGERSVRTVARLESPDFVHWTPSETVLRGTDPDHQIYGMPVRPVAGIYLGLPAIFRTREDRVHVEVAWSADTRDWRRVAIGSPLLANSPAGGAFDWGCIFAAVTPLERPDGIRLYYGASDNTHFGHRRTTLALAMLRPDGYAGARPQDLAKEATVRTRPLTWGATGNELRISADLDPQGEIGVSVHDAATGAPLGAETLTALQARQLTSERITFSPGGPAAGQQVVLQFRLQAAMLYSFEMPGNGGTQ